MGGKLVWIVVTAAIGISSAVFVTMGSNDNRADDGASDSTTPVVVVDTAADEDADAAEAPDGPFAESVAALDRQIAAEQITADRRPDDWIHYNRIATMYLSRARLSGDWNDYQHAERSLDTAFANATEGNGPHLSRASFNYTLHRLARASADLDIVEHYAVLRSDKRAAVKSLRADIAFHSGHMEEAKRLYEEIAADARSPMALTALAQWYWKTADFERANALLAEAEALPGPDEKGMRAWLALVRGLMELDRGRWDEALVHYRRGLGLMPGYWLLEEHVAEILTLQGNLDRAVPMYEDLVERTNNPEFMDAIAKIEMGRGNADAARPWIERARREHEAHIALYPEAAYGHALDHWLELEDDPARTVEMAEANVEARPGGEAKTKLAQAYLKADRIDDAQRVIEEVLETPWSTGITHATASAIYAAQGDASRAATERARALAIDPHAFDE